MEQLSKIRIAGKTIFYKKWFDAGVQNIDDVLTSDSKFLEYSCFRKEFCPTVSFLEYYGVRLRPFNALLNSPHQTIKILKSCLQS